MAAVLSAALMLALLVGPALYRAWVGFRPVAALGTVRAAASELPVLLVVPTLTPSLTPSITPTASATPSPTPMPSLTPTPSSTPTPSPTPTQQPTSTPSPSPTRARARGTATLPAPTPTPPPTLAAPTPKLPESPTAFEADSPIKLTWETAYSLGPDDSFEVTLRYVKLGAEVAQRIYVKDWFWFVDRGLYHEADQETNRAYRWSVRAVRKVADSSGNAVYLPQSPSSAEFVFYWK